MLVVAVAVVEVFSFSHKLEEERERLCLCFGWNMLEKSFGFLQLQPMSTDTVLRSIFFLVVGIAVRVRETEREEVLDKVCGMRHLTGDGGGGGGRWSINSACELGRGPK